VDTQKEKDYLEKLAEDLGLGSQVTTRIEQMVGLQPS
jgi:uncharacterized membrane protein YebE (DUF533 family)